MNQVSSRPTSIDVAREAGVSRTQVSYVLNRTGEAHVSPEKRERILEAARKLGYQAHQSAQALRRGYSNEFSIFFPAPYPPRINDMLGTIHETGLAMDCMPVQYSFNSYRDPERRLETFRSLIARRPAGLFCSLLDVGMDEIEYARSKGVTKILVLDVEDHRELSTLRIPTEEIGRLVAFGLIARGHRRIGFLKPSDPVQSRPFLSRMKGASEALASWPEVSVLSLPWPESVVRPDSRAAQEFVRSVLLPAMQGSDGITALYAYSDDYAFPILSALKGSGVRVPKDLSVLGADDHRLGALWSPALASIRFDSSDMGARAVALINALITGKPADPVFLAPMEPVLVERESLGTVD